MIFPAKSWIPNRQWTVPARKQQAFTLVEVLIVVALIGAITATAYTKLAPVYQAARIRHIKTRLIDFEQRIRGQSIRRDAAVTLEFEEHVVRALDQRLAVPDFVKLYTNGNSKVINRGQSPTYLVALKSEQQETWILFVGATGQPLELESEREARALLREVRAHPR